MVRSTNHSLRGPSHDRVEVEELVSPREPPIPYYSLLGVLGNFVWGQQKEPLFPDVGEARAGQHTPMSSSSLFRSLFAGKTETYSPWTDSTAIYSKSPLLFWVAPDAPGMPSTCPGLALGVARTPYSETGKKGLHLRSPATGPHCLVPGALPRHQDLGS